MRSPRTKRLILCSLFLTILISTVAVLSCYAEDYPDINQIIPSYYLDGNQQFFHRSGGGYALISSDLKSKTRVALLNHDGGLDYRCGKKPISVPFAYEKATLYGNFLYFAGNAANIGDCVQIGRIDLNSGAYLMNQILSVRCDFTRDFSVGETGTLSLVTVPVGGVIDPNTKASIYIFDCDHNGISINPQPAAPVSSTDSVSSGSDSSNTASTTSDALSSVSSSIVPSPTSSSPSNVTSSATSGQQPEETGPPLAAFYFDGPVTVESLQKELDRNALGQKLRVLSTDRKEIKSGNIGTGKIIETFLNGKTESRYTVVIPGDLDGTGAVTENDCRILYAYFTKSPAWNSSVLSGPFFDAAKINDDRKIDTTRKELHPSDLLKIKKLIK